MGAIGIDIGTCLISISTVLECPNGTSPLTRNLCLPAPITRYCKTLTCRITSSECWQRIVRNGRSASLRETLCTPIRSLV